MKVLLASGKRGFDLTELQLAVVLMSSVERPFCSCHSFVGKLATSHLFIYPCPNAAVCFTHLRLARASIPSSTVTLPVVTLVKATKPRPPKTLIFKSNSSMNRQGNTFYLLERLISSILLDGKSYCNQIRATWPMMPWSGWIPCPDTREMLGSDNSCFMFHHFTSSWKRSTVAAPHCC